MKFPIVDSLRGLASMRFGVLGPLEMWDGHCWAGLTAAKQRALLAALLLKANQLVSAGWLVEQLWTEQPPAAAANQLQVYVSRLRRLLNDRQGLVLVTYSPGYRLAVRPGELDVQRFEELVAVGRRALQDGALERAAGSFGEALGLWRGPALADVPSSPLVDGEVARLEECRLVVEEDRAEVELCLGHHGGLVGELQALVARQPLRERRWAQLLLALYRSGRQADALAAYQQLHHRLLEELAIAPSPPLQRLHRQILAADPALEAPPPQPSAAGAVAVPLVAPRQLPPDVAGFTGRGQELSRLGQLLATSQGGAVGVCAISGAGGVGKSALAIHAAHRLASGFPDGQLYVNLQGATPGLAPLAPIQALGRLLRALGLEAAAIPTELQEASGLLRSLLAERRLLLVLDNARDTAQVRWLLPASPSCAVLVTSRRVLATLDGACHLHLDVLPVAEATGLLGGLVGAERVAAEPAAAERLVELCGRLPLAVRIAAARLAARPAWPLAALAERLADARRRLDELDAGELAVRACFQVSHQLLARSPDQLDQQAARGFGLLGLLDTPDLGVAVAARLLELPEDVAERALERLVDAQLLDSPRPGRYRFHDLLRLFARERAQADGDEPARRAALERAFGWYTAVAEHANQLLVPAGLRDQTMTCPDGVVLADRRAALGWLEAERANLVAAARQAAANAPAPIAQVAWRLSEALWRFFDMRTDWADGQAVCQAAVQAAERAGEPAAAARALEVLGSLHGRQRRYQDAMECLQRSLAVCRQVGDRSTEGKVLNNLGCVHREQGRYQDAIGCYRQSLALRRAVGDREGEGRVCNNLGEAYREQGRYQEALGYYQQDLAICRELGDAQGEAITVDNLGDVYYAQGRYQDASGCYELALALARQVGDRLEEAKALCRRGRVAAAVQDPRAARAHWTAALGIFERLGAPDADEVRSLLAGHVL